MWNPKVGYGCTRAVQHQDYEWHFQKCRLFTREVCQTVRLEDQMRLPARDFYSTHLQLPFISRGCSLLSPLSYDITYWVEKTSLNKPGSALNNRGIQIQFPAGQKDFSVFQIAQTISGADGDSSSNGIKKFLPRREDDPLGDLVPKLRTRGAATSSALHVFMVWYLTKHRDIQ